MFGRRKKEPIYTDADLYHQYLVNRIATARKMGHTKMRVTMRELSDNTVRKPRNIANMLQVIEGDDLQHQTGHFGVSRGWLSSKTSLNTVWVFEL